MGQSVRSKRRNKFIAIKRSKLMQKKALEEALKNGTAMDVTDDSGEPTVAPNNASASAVAAEINKEKLLSRSKIQKMEEKLGIKKSKKSKSKGGRGKSSKSKLEKIAKRW